MTRYKYLLKLLIALLLIVSHECGRDSPRRLRKETDRQPSVVSGGSLNDMLNAMYGSNVQNDEVKPDSVYNEEIEDGRSADSGDFNSKLSIEVAKQVLVLSQKLTTRILNRSNKKYEILSPISISAALHLALLGANGSTFDELKSLMGYKSNEMYKYHKQFSYILEDLLNDNSKRVASRKQPPWKAEFYSKFDEKKQENGNPLHEISVANGIFVQAGYSIRPDYKAAVESVYKSDLKSLDFSGNAFESAAYINRWVNEKTKGKIKELVTGAISPNTKVILTNALYFKALWMTTFIQGATIKRKFYPNGADNPSIDFNLMAHGGSFPYYKDEDCDVGVMGFPYQKNISTMYVFLPTNSNRNKLLQAQKCLTAEKMEFMIEKMVKKTAVVLFPRMHLASGFSLKTMLKELGVQSLFKASESDLSLLSDGQEFMKRKMSSTSRMPEPVKNDMNEGIMLMPPKMPRPSLPFPLNNRDNSEDKFTFNRFGEDNVTRTKRDITYKVPSQDYRRGSELRLKDFVLRKRIFKKAPGKKHRRIKRDYILDPLQNIERARIEKKRLYNPQLFADEVIHKVDLTINERGTEGGAATAITLNRSGTNVVFRVDSPFLLLIRHDPTRIPLFYGTIFEPEEDDNGSEFSDN